jgi:hypothetical protein
VLQNADKIEEVYKIVQVFATNREFDGGSKNIQELMHKIYGESGIPKDISDFLSNFKPEYSGYLDDLDLKIFS